MAIKTEELIKTFSPTGSNVQNQISQFTEDAQKRGTKVNQETGELINPTQQDIDLFNQQFTTTSPETPKTAPVEPRIIDREALGTNIRETLKTEGIGLKQANPEFINAVAQFKLGRDATADELATGGEFGLGGATVKDVLGRFGATDLAPSFGIGIDETPAPEVVEQVPETPAPTRQKSALEQTQDLLRGFGEARTKATAEAREDVGLEAKSQAIATANTIANDARTQLANLGILQAKAAKDLEDMFFESKQATGATMRGINAEINQKLQDLSFDQKVDAIIMQNNLNNALVDVQIAQGNYDRAQDIVQQTADQMFENLQFQLQALEAQGQIESAEADSLRQQGEFERDLALQGYLQIKDPADLEGIREEEIFRDPVSGKVYKKPTITGDTFTLSPGQTRFDSEGNIIATVIKEEGDPLDELLSPNELKLFNAPAGSTMRDVLGDVPKTELTGVEKFAQEIKLGKEFESLVGDSRSAATAVENINQSLKMAEEAFKEGNSVNAASQGVLVAFQKLLDPTSVVRESEYARSGNGQSLWDEMKGKWQKIKQGGAGVTMEELASFTNTANTFLKGYQNTALKHAKRMNTIAERQGLDVNSILTEDMVDLLNKANKPVVYNNVQDWLDTSPDNKDNILNTIEAENLNEEEALQLINRINERSNLNSVGDDTNEVSVLPGTKIGDKSVARTDRHNNPTAFTTNIAEQAGLVEGVDYVKGDKFPDGNLRTAALLGDPIETTIKVIDNIGFFTRGGKQRWSHTSMSKDEWDNLTFKQKSDVIKKMYKNEGNDKRLINKFV